MSSKPASPNPQMQQAQQMFNSLSMGRKILLIAGVVGFIVSFFPWANTSYGSAVPGYSTSASVSESGWHGLGFISVLLFVVAALWVLLPMLGVSLRGMLASLPPNLTEARLVMGAGVLALLCTLIFMFTDNPAGVSGSGFSHGPSWGAYLAVLVSLAIAAAGFLIQSEPAAV
jgi:hypothetical protein